MCVRCSVHAVVPSPGIASVPRHADCSPGLRTAGPARTPASPALPPRARMHVVLWCYGPGGCVLTYAHCGLARNATFYGEPAYHVNQSRVAARRAARACCSIGQAHAANRCCVQCTHSSAPESGMQKPLSPSQHRLPKLSELEVSNFGVGSLVGFTCDHGISVINWGPTIRVAGAGSRAGAGSSDAASP